MSAAAELCSQNPLDDSIPFMAPEPYVITRAVIEKLIANVDRDIQTELEALQLYYVDFEKVERGLSKLSEKGPLNFFKKKDPMNSKKDPMNSNEVRTAFDTINRYRTYYNILKDSEIKTYAKQNFIGVRGRFLNKATNFNIKPHYIDPFYLKPNATQTLDLELIELAALKSYTKHGDGMVNNFLLTGKAYPSYKRPPIIDEILKCFSRHITLHGEDSYSKMYFIFFKFLYNTLAKIKMAYHPTNKYIRVFRGVKSHYLSQEPNKVFYSQSFLSTSYSTEVAEGFGYIKADATKYHEDYIINVFYVHPSCYYSNVKGVSRYKEEKEILITPYCRYVFLKKNTFWTRMSVRGGMPGKKYPTLYTKYYYAIFPTDLPIPASFDGFLEFVKSPPSEAGPITDTESRERVVVNIVREAPAVTCTGVGCGAMWGGHTRRRRSKRGATRKYRTK
jgi:hypothetical protein